MNPNYDILGIETGASAEEATIAFRRLQIIFEREDELDSEEFADIEAAYKAFPENEEAFDRAIWEWTTRQDRGGSWNTLVRKQWRLAKKEADAAAWDSKEGRTNKKDKMRGRKQERDRRVAKYDEE